MDEPYEIVGEDLDNPYNKLILVRGRVFSVLIDREQEVANEIACNMDAA